MRELTTREGRLWRRGQTFLAGNQLDDAKSTLEELIELIPEHVRARIVLAGIAMAKGQVRAASTQLLAAVDAAPDDVATLNMLIMSLLRIGEVVAARACADRAAAMELRTLADFAGVAHAYQTIGEHAKALAVIERAREHGLNTSDFSYFRCIQLMFNDRIAEAESEAQACLTARPGFGRAALARARLCKQSRERNHLDDLQARLQQAEPGSVDHAALEFALFKEFDDLDDADNAWRALERGNEIMHQRLPHDDESEQRLFDLLMQTCTPEFLHSANAPAEYPSPIFIIGMPRSGTTLLERILANHSLVASAGELDDFARQLHWQFDYHSPAMIDEAMLQRATTQDYAGVGARYLSQTRWRAGGKRQFIDKLPPNYLLAGLIHKALPQAPILHIVRDPVGLCFSNYKALFGDAVAYSYSLDALAAHHRRYQRLMQHWHEVMPGRILDVSYAELVSDTEATLRKIFAHCQLPWEPQCLDISSAGGPVATLSAAQVREPIHARSLAEWRRYERQLEPLRHALSESRA